MDRVGQGAVESAALRELVGLSAAALLPPYTMAWRTVAVLLPPTSRATCSRWRLMALAWTLCAALRMTWQLRCVRRQQRRLR